MGKNRNRNKNGGGGNNQGGNNPHQGNNSHQGNSSHHGSNSHQGNNSDRGNNHHNVNNNNHNNKQNSGRNGKWNNKWNRNHGNNQNGNGNNNQNGNNSNTGSQNGNRNNNSNQNGNWNNSNNQTGHWKKRRQQYWQLIAGAEHVGQSQVLSMFLCHSIRIGLLAQSYATVCHATGGYKSTDEFITKHRAQIHDCELFCVQGRFQNPSITPHSLADKIEQFLEQHAAFIYEQWILHDHLTHYPGFRMEDFLAYIRGFSTYSWEPVINAEGVQGNDTDEDVVMVDDGSSHTIYLAQLCKFAPLPYLTVRFGLVNPDVPGHSLM
ncbi:hypothetical protein QC762_211310 [Podospora pseudocomata]|uniref:Uncharacterized protein n=1 Tax=Podospora pseudocomata TaxID=2093779 RepID=A0ABR0GND1_9PEZI|nr:hypothetical protein QC762_211310 [Podospora pseudocomata]